MNQEYNRIMKCVEYIKEKVNFQPEIGLVLGSGLGGFAKTMNVVTTLSYKDIPGFPFSTVPGHKGQFVFGHVDHVPVMAMEGRVHFYEGYSMEDVVLPARVMGLLGIKVLFLTNAAGGVNENFHRGDLMLITDQISSFVPNPLIGENMDSLGTRFPDMSQIYDKELQNIIEDAAEKCQVPIQKGVYLQFTGPSYETPAEIRMVRTLGADAVGMSTTVEAIAARHMGIRVCGISCITNMASGILNQPLNHEEVSDTAHLVEKKFTMLVQEGLNEIYRKEI